MDPISNDRALEAEGRRSMTEEDRAGSWWAGLDPLGSKEESAAVGSGGPLSPEESR